MGFNSAFKGLNTELNLICHLLTLLGGHHILHISRIRVNIYWFIVSQCSNVCRQQKIDTIRVNIQLILQFTSLTKLCVLNF